MRTAFPATRNVEESAKPGPRVTVARLCYASGMTFLKGWLLVGIMIGAACLLPKVALQAQQVGEQGDNPQVRAAMNDGIASFKAGQYAEAAAIFRTATVLAPGYLLAHLYLGTAESCQIVPDLLTPENLQTAALALTEFDKVLKDHPEDLTAIKQEAAIYRYVHRYDEAIAMEKRAVAIQPEDAEAIYTIGVIDWTRAYNNAIASLAAEGLTDDGEGNAGMSMTACEKLRALNTSLVEDGITNLSRAIEINPNYSDAMQYMQLTYRLHADFACGNKASLARDLKLADELRRKAFELREQPPSTRVK